MDLTTKAGAMMTQATARFRLAQGPATDDAARAAAQEFEAVFLTQVMDEMLKTVDLGTMDGGFAEETWRSFMARAYADELAARGTTGIAQSVEATIGAYRNAMTAKGGA